MNTNVQRHRRRLTEDSATIYPFGWVWGYSLASVCALGEWSLWWGVCVIGHMVSMTARSWDTVPLSVPILEERYDRLPQQVWAKLASVEPYACY